MNNTESPLQKSDRGHWRIYQTHAESKNMTKHSKFNWLLAFLLTVLFFPLFGNTAEPKPEAETWKINGALAAFEDSNPEVQAKALDKLREFKSLGTIPIKRIVDMLEIPDVDVRVTAIRALGAMGEVAKNQAPMLVDLLKDPDEPGLVRFVAAEALRAMGEAAKDQAPMLVDLLNDLNEDVSMRAAAAKALGAMGEAAKDQVPKIANLLNDPNASVRAAVAEALGAMGEAAKDQVPKIANLLNDPNASVRAAAAKALGAMGEAIKDQVPELVNLLDDPARDVRAAAVEALGIMGDVTKDQILKIANLLDDPDEDVRATAAQALGAIGEAAKDQAPKLVNLLKDPDEDVRAAAVKALGAIGAATEDQVPKIANLLDDPNEDVRAAAVKALGVMGEAAKDQAPKIANLLDDSNEDVRAVATRVLGAMGEAAKDQAPMLVDLLNDPARGVRAAAVEALGIMGEAAEDQVPKIANLLNDPNASVRAIAAQALGAIGEAAKDQVPKIANLLNDPDASVRAAAVKALGTMGEAAKDQVPKIANLLNDPNGFVRATAAQALGIIGEIAKDQAPRIANLLNDVTITSTFPMEPVFSDFRPTDFRPTFWGFGSSVYDTTVIDALTAMGPLDLKSILHILSPVYGNISRVGELRFLAHFLGGGKEGAEILIKWLGIPENYPDTIMHDDGVNNLKVFEKAWEASTSLPRLHDDLEKQIAIVASTVTWKRDDLPLLRRHASNLKSSGSIYAVPVQNTISSLERKRWFSDISKIALKIWPAHALFWLLLTFIYPKSSQIQAIFFWNRWVRRITGLGYVGFALTWVPYLRLKLLAPFKESLLSDAALESFDPQAYFEESKVKIKTSECIQPIREVIPKIKGQIVLEGDSGLGKTMFLRHLVKRSKRIVVYLPAEKCSRGVIEAIQAKLHGPARDPDFLRNLIYSRAIDICIDGLNEVTADTRARVTEFVESYFKGNIIMVTQPLEWTPPSTAKIYIMQPLTQDQIERFLLTREQSLPEDATVSGTDYEQACLSYLSEALNEQQPEEALASAKRILSNPMDLTVVAHMLAREQDPDLFHLQEQQYNIMAADYKRVNNQEFPLDSFSEKVFQMRLKDEVALSGEEYLKELQCMERHKMVVIRQALDAQGNLTKEWHFRHDKIREFFIVQTFLGPDNNRPQEYLSDLRFRGVYFLLAVLMPLEDAQALREQLIQYAADTKDHIVSDTFIQLFRSRTAAAV
ncbi:MAG: HEAT repeat domain-containing protein [Candidatus Bipolaricaulia bacterium]